MKQNMLLLCLLISAFLTVSCEGSCDEHDPLCNPAVVPTPTLPPSPTYPPTPLPILEPGETRLPQTPSANGIPWPAGPIPQPGITLTPTPTFQETTAVALLLDISKSFEELCSNTEKELRLNIPRFVIGFARGYHGVAHDHAAQIQIGWHVFPDDKIWGLWPLSEFDGNVWYEQIEQDLAVSERGLGFMEAIQDAVNKLQASEARHKVIILITDGMMDYYQLESNMDAEEESIRNIVPSLLINNQTHLQVLQLPCLGDSVNNRSESQELRGRRQIWKELNGDERISDLYSLVDAPIKESDFSNYVSAIFEGEKASLEHLLPIRVENEAGWDWIKQPTATWQTPGDTQRLNLYAVLVNDQTTIRSNIPNFSNIHNEPPNLLHGSEKYEISLAGCTERQGDLRVEPTSLMGIYWWEAETLREFTITFQGQDISQDENRQPIIRLYSKRDFELIASLSHMPKFEECYDYKLFLLPPNYSSVDPILPYSQNGNTLSYHLSYNPAQLGLNTVTISLQIWRKETSIPTISYAAQTSIPLQVYFEPIPISYSWSCSGSEARCQLQLKLDFTSAEYYVNNEMIPELYALTSLQYLNLQEQGCEYLPKDQTMMQEGNLAYQIYQDNDNGHIFFTRDAGDPNKSETITISLPQNWLGEPPCLYRRIVLQFPQREDRWPGIICDWQGNQMSCFASANAIYRVSKNSSN